LVNWKYQNKETENAKNWKPKKPIKNQKETDFTKSKKREKYINTRQFGFGFHPPKPTGKTGTRM